jgi:tetratricopeptide (TPR) repeat protein
LSDAFGGDRKILLAIVLIALALRIAYIVDVRSSPYFDQPTLDSFWYHSKARDVLAGDLLASTGTFRVPLYVYFIAGIYGVFGESYTAVLAVQAILGAWVCGLLYLLGRRLFGTLAGVIAGLGFALYGMAVYGVGEILPSTLMLFLLIGAVYFLVDALEGGRPGRSVLAGICLGLAFLTHPDMLLCALILGVVVAVAFRRQRGIRVAVTMLGVLVCFLLLQGLRNYAIFDRFFVFSPQGAVNLYIGNAPYADGKTPAAPPTSHPYDIGTDPSQDSITLGCRQAALEDVGRELSDRELSGYYLRRTFGEIRDDPGRWLGLLERKVYYFINSYERSDIKPIPRIRSKYSAVLGLPLLPFAVPFSLGAVGMVLVIRRRRRPGLIPVAGVIAYGLSSVMFFVVWRYRLPAVPFLLLLAGLTVSEFLAAIQKRDVRLLAGIAAGVVALSAISLSRFYDVDEEEWASHYLINEAALYLMADDYDRAVEVYHEALRMDPENARIYFYLGKAHATEGRLEESKEMMNRAVEINPVYRPYAMLTLGVAMANQGRYEAAVDYFSQALAADETLGLAAFNLGVSLLKLGRLDEAKRAFTHAEKLCKEDTERLVAIAGAYVSMGENQGAVSLALKVLEREPRNVDALFTAGLGLEAEGRTAEALGYFEAALMYRPGSAEIIDRIRSLRNRGSPLDP